MRRALAVSLFLAGPLAAQSPIYPDPNGGTGFEFRTFQFDRAFDLQSASQVVVPVFAGTPIGSRLFVDLTANYAHTRLRWLDGTETNLSGLTDSQLRFSYTLGRDLAVVSTSINLPTGKSSISSQQLTVLRSTAQDFLPFPVSNYGTSAGVTGGWVVARRVGDWSIGLAGSLRYVSTYQPFTDVPGDFSPGMEGRMRIGVLRPVGERTTITTGFTFSNFGTDELTGTSNFDYRSGNRYVGEVGLSHLVGRSTLELTAWTYFRAAGDSNNVSVQTAKENLHYGRAAIAIPVTDRLQIDPSFETRFWIAGDGSDGQLYGLNVRARYNASPYLTIAPSLHYDGGNIKLVEPGVLPLTSSITGFGGALLVRYSR
ncbi:MAG: hypothetical protein ACE5HT_08310 [Gemmatimonadales bacterium]